MGEANDWPESWDGLSVGIIELALNLHFFILFVLLLVWMHAVRVAVAMSLVVEIRNAQNAFRVIHIILVTVLFLIADSVIGVGMQELTLIQGLEHGVQVCSDVRNEAQLEQPVAILFICREIRTGKQLRSEEQERAG